MKSARVLVVDDERPIVEIVLRALAQRGHLGTGADSAEAAAAALSAAPFDLVLLDHVLPGTTGMQALPRLRALTKAPIYVMSGYTGDDTRKDVMLLGASGFMPKPLVIAEIFALLEALPEIA
ncbi:MAG: response regulator [Elusimicrobia bacterium]|nr:response regulator [Elusimicrobiota bacterium]